MNYERVDLAFLLSAVRNEAQEFRALNRLRGLAALDKYACYVESLSRAILATEPLLGRQTEVRRLLRCRYAAVDDGLQEFLAKLILCLKWRAQSPQLASVTVYR